MPFQDIDLGRLVLKYWMNGCRISGAVPHVVCVMPDHLHMIVEVRAVGLIKLMQGLKSHSTTIYRTRTGKSTLWQQSFHDHGLRDPQDFESAVEYIVFNPVRAELVESWEDYPLLVGDYLTNSYPPE
jgi:REP element-mobilizing transposase RayT